jgi:hypothetical protein
MISPATMNLNTGGNRVGRWSNMEPRCMSALGHKRTYAPQQAMSALHPIATTKADMPQTVMSALPPKADMCSATRDVRFGPEAVIGCYSINRRRGREMIDLLAMEKPKPKPKPTKIRAVSYEAAMDQLFKRLRSS